MVKRLMQDGETFCLFCRLRFYEIELFFLGSERRRYWVPSLEQKAFTERLYRIVIMELISKWPFHE